MRAITLQRPHWLTRESGIPVAIGIEDVAFVGIFPLFMETNDEISGNVTGLPIYNSFQIRTSETVDERLENKLINLFSPGWAELIKKGTVGPITYAKVEQYARQKQR